VTLAARGALLTGAAVAVGQAIEAAQPEAAVRAAWTVQVLDARARLGRQPLQLFRIARALRRRSGVAVVDRLTEADRGRLRVARAARDRQRGEQAENEGWVDACR
jgi:hypothetical protein